MTLTHSSGLVLALVLVLQPSPASTQTRCTSPGDLEELIRVGSINGEVTLNRVRDVAVGPDGNAYVAQGGEPYVAVFDADGRRLPNVGRAGEGPGEFSSAPIQIAWRADTLVVSSVFRTQYFSLKGEELRRFGFRARIHSESSTFVAGAPLADGSFLGSRMLNPPTRVFWTATDLPIRRFTAEGAVIDTIALIDHVLPAPGDEAFQHQFENRLLDHPLGWRSDGSWLPFVQTKDGTAVVLIGNITSGPSATFDLLKIGIQGNVLLKSTIPYVPVEISEAAREAVTEAFAARFVPAHLPSGQAERQRVTARRALSFPRHYPPVRAIVAGADGSIWLLRESAPSDIDVWEIYGEDGALQGAVQITEGRSGAEPWRPRLRLLDATREEAWGVTTDELDVPYLHRFRVRAGCE